jgi:hypothetical protein
LGGGQGEALHYERAFKYLIIKVIYGVLARRKITGLGQTASFRKRSILGQKKNLAVLGKAF